MSDRTGLSRGDRNRNARLARLRQLLPVENAIVGIDLADSKQAAVVTDHDSRVIARRRVTARAWELGGLLGWALATAVGSVTVACEPTGHRWRVLDQLARKSTDEHPSEDDTALLIAAFNHSTAWYETRIDRGLQVINYFVIAGAVLATAYVSAISGKHYAIAVVVSLSGTALAALALLIGVRQRHYAAEVEPALAEIQDRVADRLKIDTFRIVPLGSVTRRELSVRIAFSLAALLSLGSALYALIH